MPSRLFRRKSDWWTICWRFRCNPCKHPLPLDQKS
jgi:hypothetical protein